MNQLTINLFNEEAREVKEAALKKNHKFECYCCKDVWPNKVKVKVAPGVDFDEWCYLKMIEEGI